MSGRAPIPRPVIVLVLLVVAHGVAQLTGAGSWFQMERVHAWAASFGPMAPLVYVAIIAAGVVAQIPGLVFILAAPALFPLPIAIAVSVVGGNLAANANFALVRALGGKPRPPPEGGLLERAFSRLTTHPVRAVAMIRFVGLVFPPLTAALALTPLRGRDHALGTVIGLSPMLTAIVAVESLLFG